MTAPSDALKEYVEFVAEANGREITAEDAEKKEKLFHAISQEVQADRQAKHDKAISDRQEEVLDEIGEEQVVRANNSVLGQWENAMELVKEREITTIDLLHTEYSTAGKPGLHTEFIRRGANMIVKPVCNDPSGNIEQLMLSQGSRNINPGEEIIGLRTQFSTHTGTTDAPIPISFIDRWSTEQADDGPMLDRALCDVERTNRIQKRTYPRLDSEPAGVALTAETDASDNTWGLKSLPVTDPSFDEVEISMYKYGALHAISDETLHSAYVSNFVGELAAVFTKKLAQVINKDLTTGNGTNKPKGIVAAADGVSANRRTVAKTANAATFTNHTVENAVKLMGDLDIGYSENAPTYFMGRQDALIQIALEDSTSRFIGAPNREYGAMRGVPRRKAITNFNTIDAISNPHMDNSPDGANKVLLLYGDFKAYKTLLSNMRLDFSSQHLFDKAALVLRVLQYAGGDLRACGGTRTGQKGRIVVLRNGA